MVRKISMLAPFFVRTSLVGAAAAVSLMAADASALPRNAMPMRNAPHVANPEAVTAGACGGLVYGGGPVISKGELVGVYWGPASTYVKGYVPGYLQNIAASPYIDQLSEYNTSTQKIVRGTYTKSVQITPSITSKTVDNAKIGGELAKQITAGVLPAPTYD